MYLRRYMQQLPQLRRCAPVELGVVSTLIALCVVKKLTPYFRVHVHLFVSTLGEGGMRARFADMADLGSVAESSP